MTNALELLKADHERINLLFDQIEVASHETEARDIFDKIYDELEIHALIEEAVFYPAFNEFIEFEDIIEESYGEHQDVKDLLAEIDETDDYDDFMKLIGELTEDVQFHVELEEQDLFPMVRTVLDDQALEKLGFKMNEEKDRIAHAPQSTEAA